MAVIYYPTAAEVLKRTATSSSLTEIHIGVVPGLYFFFTGSNEFTASSTSSYALTASYSVSASWAPGTPGTLGTGSTYPFTSSAAISSSYSVSSSWAPGTPGTLGTGSTYPFTSSWSTQAISSSVTSVATSAFSTGALDLVMSDGTGNEKQLYADPARLTFDIATGRVVATSSWADNVVSTPFIAGTMSTGSTYPITASVSVTASFWNSSSIATILNNKQNNLSTGSTIPITSSWATNTVNAAFVAGTMSTGSSYPITASWSTNVVNAPFVAGTMSTGSTYPITASSAVSSSYALSASWAPGTGGSLGTGSTYPFTSSYAVSSSYALNGGISSIGITIDGGGSVITTGVKGYISIPYSGVIQSSTLLADQSGSLIVDVYKCTYAQFDAGATHPIATDSITSTSPPTISASYKAQDTTLSSWTTLVSANDVIAFNVSASTSITRATLTLKIQQ